ncbi:DUF2865 domain-containing protein [Bradyrhizobium sp. AUGA SZCCT0431]|uniref:DUF2865 domain-containing protein n=1 Tax=Bradyrhizobium sp. AUGA SZCCT0431 TaxID=2807674 RepID=UPI001BA6A0DC|nr:DUF2865 domain-containing protein [Bradyrhizobium sp. AUGA SZCCT0431]MBR1142684.1 DUF2865 domain-containing protein [Bradyrhizobium sp. AUGA SZCCT0431]
MPLTLTAPFSRWILTCAVLLAGIAATNSAAVAQADPAQSNMDALAQMPPGAAPPPQQQGAQANPICIRLEGQLAAVDRGASGGDPAKEEQIRRYQEAATKQQAELDRVTMQAKRMGCESSGFFSLFNGQSAQCGPVNNQIQQMRGNLEQMTTSLERLRSGGIGGADRENQRRSVLTALAQNNCGPQYAAAARSGGSFIDNLFGNNTIPPPSADLGAPSGTFRTVCVRTCDGAYFPVSFATYQARFQDDEKTCKALCPATEASLFTYRNPGEDINQAVSVSGQPYSSLPNAFKFRTEFNPSCACKAAGQTWSDALKSIDEKAAAEQQGDIIVTEESAKRMQQRAMPQQKTAPVAKKGTAPAGTTAAAPAPATPAPAAESTGATDEKKPIRTVGPTFIPPKQ